MTSYPLLYLPQLPTYRFEDSIEILHLLLGGESGLDIMNARLDDYAPGDFQRRDTDGTK